MTLAERARIATAVRVRMADERARALSAALASGECLKRAASKAGVSYRTARRYRKERLS
jgi:molybdenum-dependent DNA-binding transcriptional regulator ModE